MNRKALIIYCTKTDSGPLTGPKMDNNNIREYLKSDVGGQWYDKEIISLENPTISQVRRCITNEFVNVDYSFIVFSGHGYIDESDNKDYLEVANGDIPLSMLIPSVVPRQTLIIDACRGYYSRINDSLQKSFSNLYEYFSGHPDTRTVFDSAVCQAEEGLTILYSASENQSSLDTNKGGAYIYSLLSICKEWEEVVKNRNVYLDLKDAHDYACKYLKDNFNTIQRPTMNMEKRRTYFPIAVM
ncbi:MAG: caspase family protein [Bacteroidales bacterium]|nr:caspase family protein [Bacteroidales bacterium]